MSNIVSNTTLSPTELQSSTRDFIADFQSCGVLRSLDDHLVGLGERYYGQQRQINFIQFLVEQVRRQSPFCAIRLGDGEGNIMFAADPGGYEDLSNYAFSMIWKLMFGQHQLSVADKQIFITEFIRSIQDADILGIPTKTQVESTTSNGTQQTNLDIRGITGVLGNWKWVYSHRNIFDRHDRYCGIWHYHIKLADYLQDLLSASYKVSVITCYEDFFDVLEVRYHFNRGILITIPPQSSNINATPETAHYPARYIEILRELKQDLTGHTFLIGAGLLGKMYCSAIKKSGGIAIDIGSLIDVLVGNAVRPWHSSGILEKYAIRRNG
jgi:hypothetical protein